MVWQGIGMVLVPVLVTGLWFKGRKKYSKVLAQLHQPLFLRHRQMARIVKWECARTDRSGAEFVLAVFPLGDRKNDYQLTQTLEIALRGRARLTDVVGWMNDDSLCALLVDTTMDGAQAFADTLTGNVRKTHRLPDPVIYTYGGKWHNINAAKPAPAEPLLAKSA